VRAVILGGTFNPVHVGHLVVAEDARTTLGYDKAIFVPANRPVHKDPSPILEPHHRLAMLRLAAAGHEPFIVDDADIVRGGASYSIETVADLIPRYGIEGKPGFVIGDDLVAGFPTWKNVDELVRIVDLIVARRTLAGPVPLAYPHRTVTNIVLPVSSSEIRRRVGNGLSVHWLVPEPVRAYIRDNALYER
jgi:nicotinate-nucleotide adenylyltransferase